MSDDVAPTAAQLRERIEAGGAAKYHEANASKGKLFARDRVRAGDRTHRALRRVERTPPRRFRGRALVHLRVGAVSGDATGRERARRLAAGRPHAHCVHGGRHSDSGEQHFAREVVFERTIYGDSPVVPKIEEMPPEPKSPYAISKLDGEFHCRMFAAEGRLPTACLRYFNVFGPRQNPRSQYAAAVPIFIDRALKNKPITIFGDGEQTRDFIHVQDVVAANVFFATQSPALGVFNVAGGQRLTINELAANICRLTGTRSKIKHAAERPGDVKHSLADIGKLRAAGFIPPGDFHGGLQTTIRFFKGGGK